MNPTTTPISYSGGQTMPDLSSLYGKSSTPPMTPPTPPLTAVPNPVSPQVTPPPAPTPTMVAPISTTSTTQTETQPSATDILTSQLSDITEQERQISQSYQNSLIKMNSTLEGIRTGTVPLSPYEQAQLDATKSILQSTIEEQKRANTEYISGLKVSQENRGLSRYSPEMAQGEIFAATTEANKKIADLNAKMSLNLAQMETAFRDNDFNKVKDAFQYITAAKAEKTKALEDLYNTVASKQAQIQKQQQESVMTDVQSVLMDDEYSLSQKKGYIAKVASMGLLTPDQMKDLQGSIKDIEKQESDIKKDKFDQEYKLADLKIKEIDAKVKAADAGLNYDPVTGNLTPIKGDGPPVAATELPGVKEIQPGISYFDPNEFSDNKQKARAENVARAAGIPILSEKAAEQAQQITTAIERLDDAEKAFRKIATPNAFGSTIGAGIGSRAGDIFLKPLGVTTEWQSARGDYDVARKAVISLASQLAGGGRGLSAVLSQMDNVLPKSGGGFWDVPANIKDAEGNFKGARKLLYSAIKTYIPNSPLPESGEKIYSDIKDLAYDKPTLKLANGTTVNTLDYAAVMAKEHPEWSNDYILKLLNQ